MKSGKSVRWLFLQYSCATMWSGLDSCSLYCFYVSMLALQYALAESHGNVIQIWLQKPPPCNMWNESGGVHIGRKTHLHDGNTAEFWSNCTCVQWKCCIWNISYISLPNLGGASTASKYSGGGQCGSHCIFLRNHPHISRTPILFRSSSTSNAILWEDVCCICCCISLKHPGC